MDSYVIFIFLDLKKGKLVSKLTRGLILTLSEWAKSAKLSVPCVYIFKSNLSWAKLHHTGLPTKDETVKATQNSKNMTIWCVIFDFCIQFCILMVYGMINHRYTVLAEKEPWMQENWLYKFHSIVSEVSFFVGNPVHL